MCKGPGQAMNINLQDSTEREAGFLSFFELLDIQKGR